ncbi:YegJ family protein [Chryseobacterium oryctis]|uniref:DUF2314 domain-containing protein n=1 Tax=Chryseobacterium oryctis TaxID=2952618 RepID=A0ABT3HQF8_9FLAO|nr:DUF2314 domain-containing protein [Chryseobacterium oryctis]MCW3162020.1 DUF2314 domain-containing protein [Chryseobacterium oryctis]
MRKILVIFLLTFLVNCQEKKEHEKLEREGEPDVVYFENSDAEMNSAVQQAQKTLSEFQKALEDNNPNHSNFTLKQRFDTSDGGGEHIWIGEVQLKNGKYFGIVQNEPVDVKTIKLGDSVEVPVERISDWMYYDKNVVKGAYTIKVMRKFMSPEEKKEMDAEGLIYE